MPFVRDTDAHTRGVNAVAAFDATSSRGRRRELLKQRAMQRRDRAMALAARGAMGAIDANKIGAGGGFRPVIQTGGGGVTPTPDAPGRSGLGTRAPQGGAGNGGSLTVIQRAKALLATRAPTAVIDPVQLVVAPFPTRGGMVVDPGPSSSNGGSAVTSSGGGTLVSGGGGGVSSGGGASSPDSDLGPDVDITPTTVDDGGSSTLKTALLIGGGLLGLYLLFGKD